MLDLHPEACVLLVDDNALAFRVELDLDLVVLLQSADCGLCGLCYQGEETFILYFRETAVVEVEEGDVESGDFIDLGLDLTQLEGSGVEVASLHAPQHHNLHPHAGLAQGLGEFLRGPEDGERVLVLVHKNAELVAHLVQLVAAEHVQLIPLPHEYPHQTPVEVDPIVMLVLNPLDLLLVHTHENPVLYRIAREVHRRLLGVPLRPLKKPSPVLLDVNLGLLALLLQPQLVLEFQPLVLLLEGGLHLEVVDPRLIQNGDQLFGLAQVGDVDFQVEVLPHT